MTGMNDTIGDLHCRYRIRSNKRATKKIIRYREWRSFRERKLTNTRSGAFLEWHIANRETRSTVTV